MLCRIHRNSDWIIPEDKGEWFPCDLFRLPVYQEFILVGVGWISTVTGDGLYVVEIPLLDISFAPFEHTVVCHDLLEDLGTRFSLEGAQGLRPIRGAFSCR